MSKKQHEKQLERARQKRQKDRYERRASQNKVVVFALVGLLVLSLGAGALVGVIGGGDDAPAAAPDDAPVDEPDLDALLDDLPEAVCPPVPEDAPEPSGQQYDESPGFDVAEGVTYVATVTTSCGDIVIELDTDGSPATAANFLGLAADGFYAGTPFHRIIPDFVIQGGDPTGTGGGGPGYQFEDELETAEALEPVEVDGEPVEGFVVYPRGIVAMANAGPDTQGSQFFIVTPEAGQQFPPAYTVFGTVLEGMDVVDDIAAGPALGDQAVDPVQILEVTIEER